MGIEKESESVKKEMESIDPPRVITQRAIEKTCAACQRALQLFVSIYGSEAGNLALKIFSLGGMFIGGGIAPKILKEMQEGQFMERFVSKGRFASFLKEIPVKVILNENTALLGAAQYVRERI
jgi:glucokinase